jgi:alpha-2-macroglobulin
MLPVTLRNLEPQLAARMSAMPAKMLKLTSDSAPIGEWLRRVEGAAAPSGEWVDEDTPAAKDDSVATARPRVWREDTGTVSVFGALDATTSFNVQEPAGKKAAEVIGIPLKEPGFYVVELESRLLGASLLGRSQTRYVSTAALVTNLAVHFKWGRESSRVWVTRLDSGVPVTDADVTISDYCSGAALWSGKTAHDGIATVNESLGEPHGSATCNPYSPRPLLVAVKTAKDFSFTQSGWGQGIDPYQFSVPVGNRYSADIYHTVFDRSLFRAGETVSMTHFLRHHQMNGLATLEGMPAKRKVSIVHQGSGQHYEVEAVFGNDGIAETQWKIPEEAKLGDYVVSIVEPAPGSRQGEPRSRQSGRFKVEQFRLPSMRATATLPALPVVNPKQVPLDVHIAYLSGGGASGLAVKLRTMVEAQALRFTGYDDYQFGGGSVKAGITSDGNDAQDPDAERDPDAAAGKAQVVPLTLDGAGSARVIIPTLPTIDTPSRLTAEVEYADANGELLTTTARVRLVPSALSLGIRRDGWVATTDQMRFRVVVLDLDGNPRGGQSVTTSFYQSSAYSYRKRLIGGFYAYETTRDTHKLAMTCNGTTDAQGLLVCDVAPGVSGEVLVRAEARDTAGRATGATTSIWVAGKDDWWFGGTSGDRMDLLPEKKKYEAGETARFQVRMPFRSATALVTVEREGVLSSFVTHLDGHSPVLEVPIADSYAPNVFVSVLALRGRVAHAENNPGIAPSADITALVDLNKPSYRVGVAEIKVGWKPHQLEVNVTPAQKTYKVRDQAEVQIHVARADGAGLPAGAEVTIAAVDEALLELAPNPSWALLDAMMGERGLEVWTSTAQMQVVGKRHYGRKAVPRGGGGGRELDRAREQFDSLLFWKGRYPLDAHGNATVRVPLNDSLSSFRIVAIAHAGAQLYGTGSASIATTQDLILLSGLPPLVREGDRFAATFTARNTTQQARNVDLRAVLTPTSVPTPTSAPGAPEAPEAGTFEVQRVAIPAGQSRDVSWQITVPVGAPSIAWQVEAWETNGTAHDRLKIVQHVIPAFPIRTYQSTIAQLAQPLSLPAQRPTGAVPGRGGLEISVRAQLGNRLDGVREYMSRYPYICLEQQLSRAVALRDRVAWDAMTSRLPAYMDGDGLLKYFPSERLDGDDALSAYVLAIADEAGWPVVAADRQQVIQALRRFVTGKLIRRSALPTADLTIRKLAALDALSRYGAADPGMLDSLTIEPNLWPTSAVLDWLGILQRVAGVPNAPERRNQALQILRLRLNFQGTIMGFSTERSDALWWLMISSDSNANRLLLATLALPQWREDIPRLVRGALGRQQNGHWNTTLANAWGVLAMEKFSAAFEATPVTGATGVRYAATQRVISWPQAQGAADLSFPWVAGSHTLGLAHTGSGKPWIMVRATAALPLDHALFTGFKIIRTVTPIEQRTSGRFSRGDVVRIRLDLEAQSDMSWVVVDDPVPAGATVLGSGLGGQSELLPRDETRGGWAWPAFEERRFDAYRAYYRFVPKGRWSTEYTLRLNNPGSFLLPATRVEAMYAPEMFGELPNTTVTVDGESDHH